MVKIFFKKMSVIMLALALTLGNFQGANASTGTSTLGSWDLVDSGKHLDWDGNTNYMNQYLEAISVWNGYKSGVIRKDNWKIVEDVKIQDVSGDNTTIVTIEKKGKIKFNQNVMDKLTDDQKTNACLGALGICLGLGWTKNTNDVMYKYKSSKTVLSENDKASYDSAYKKY